MRSRALRWAITAAVLAVVAYFFGRGLARNWDAVREIDLRIDGWTVASVLLFAIAVVVSGVLWGHLVSKLSGATVGLGEAVRVQCASWLLKYVPGQVGSVTNKIVWAGDRGLSRTLVVVTFVYENVFLLLGSIVPTVVILLLWPAGTVGSGDPAGAVLPALLALVPLLLVMNRRLFHGGVNLVARRALKRDVPAEYFLRPPTRSATSSRSSDRGSSTVWASSSSRSSLVGVPASTYVPLAAAYVLAGAVGILAVFVPSGLGVRESVVVVLASRYLPVEQAIVLSLAARLLSTVGDGVVALIYAGLRVVDVKGAREA